jgi:hypothetical protein
MKTESATSDKSSKTPPPITAKIEDAAHKSQAKVEATVETILPIGSWRRVAAGVGAATIGGLWAAAWVGAGPAALAGAAGYLAYRKLHAEKKVEPSIKH